MPILELQRQQTETGRIRLGILVPSKNGKQRPTKLTTFRLTSRRRSQIEQIAALYGGTVEQWVPQRGNTTQWQVITETDEIPVLVPPQDPSQSQWYEMWSGRGCLRRCDGQTEKLSAKPCLCDAERLTRENRCKMHTRLNVMLADITGLGVWHVSTGSYYAALELPGVAQLLVMAQGVLPARLVLDQRQVVRNGETLNFAVPTLHVDRLTPAELASGKVPELVQARMAEALEATTRKALTAGASTDYMTLIKTAQTMTALTELFQRAQAEGKFTEELRGVLNARANEIRRADHAKTTAPVVDGELVDGPPEDVDALWDDVVEAYQGSTDELMAEFATVTGCAPDEADAATMRRFLTHLGAGVAA